MARDIDVIVIGLGIMGAAAAAELAMRGLRVVGLEAHHPGHAMGSSHGDTRLIRLGYFEDPSYVPLLQRAYRNWRRLEQLRREALLFTTGVLHIGGAQAKVVQGTQQACQQHGLPFELLSAADVRERFPVFALDDDEVGLFEPQGGYLLPERALAAWLALAASHGAALYSGERVLGIDADDGGVSVRTDRTTLRARKVIVATGAWIGQLVPALAQAAQPIRQVVAWFQPQERFLTSPHRMPVFLRDNRGDGSFFGFPLVGPQGVKVGKHAHLREPVTPDVADAAVNAADLAMLQDCVTRYVPGAAGPLAGHATCRYTMLPTENFLIDTMPGQRNVIVASPCSGHGFKFASVVGEILADLAQHDGTDLPIDLFSFGKAGLCGA